MKNNRFHKRKDLKNNTHKEKKNQTWLAYPDMFVQVATTLGTELLLTAYSTAESLPTLVMLAQKFPFIVPSKIVTQG